MLSVRLRVIITLLCLSAGMLPWIAGSRQAAAASANLAWRPYLQQVSSSGVIILWATKVGSTALVRFSPDASLASSAHGLLHPLAALGTQLNRVSLTGLQPGTTYSYKIYTDGEDLMPGVTLSFRTAPTTGATTPFRFMALGDFGAGSTSAKALRDQMLRDPLDFI